MKRFILKLILIASDLNKRPVVYLSKLLNEIECNYEIHDKKILAVIRGLDAWRHLLEGTIFKFEVWFYCILNLLYFIFILFYFYLFSLI